MDDQSKYEALTSEYGLIPAFWVRDGQETKTMYVRAFKDEGGLVRLHLEEMTPDETREQFQIVIGADKLRALLDDPQDVEPQTPPTDT